jgi:flagellar protein FlgJ
MANVSVPLPQGVMALGSAAGPSPDAKAKARANAVDFEAMFLSTMFSHMFTSVDGEGPFGGGGGGGVWRSFLSDEYAKSFAKAGGVGIADSVYRSLLAQQEARAS